MHVNSGQIVLRSRRVTSHQFPSPTTLDVSLGTANSLLSHARRRLRKEITKIQDLEIEDEL